MCEGAEVIITTPDSYHGTITVIHRTTVMYVTSAPCLVSDWKILVNRDDQYKPTVSK